MIPDYFEPLEAWRKFGVADRGRVLTSVAIGGGWTQADPGPAFCHADSHDEPTPHLGCSCGYYGYKTRGHAELHGQGHILARCEVWGRIAEHANGYRADRIRLTHLYLLDRDVRETTYDIASDAMVALPNGDPSALEKRYQIPVTILKGQTAWISENPNGSSSSSLSLNPSSFQIGQTVHIKLSSQRPHLTGNHSPQQLQNYGPVSFQYLAQFQPLPLIGPGSNYAGMVNMASWTSSDDGRTKQPKRQFFDFSD